MGSKLYIWKDPLHLSMDGHKLVYEEIKNDLSSKP